MLDYVATFGTASQQKWEALCTGYCPVGLVSTVRNAAMEASPNAEIALGKQLSLIEHHLTLPGLFY